MANKLYDDASVKAIADSIRSATASTATYTIGEMAPAINDLHMKHIVVNNTSNVIGENAYLTLTTGLQDLRDIETLIVMVVIRNASAGNFKSYFYQASNSTFALNNPEQHQNLLRYSSSGTSVYSTNIVINSPTPAQEINCLWISPGGELRAYATGSAYSIPAGLIDVYILW